MYFKKNISRLDYTQGLIHSTLCSIKNIVLKCDKGVVIKSTELTLQLILFNFYGTKRHTCRELELPLLSSQLHISVIFIVEKRLLFRS